MPVKGKLEILYYTPYFRETLKDAIGFAPEVAEDLCVVTLDHTRFSHADAVLFHLPNMAMDSIPPTKTPGQIWIGMSMESDANYPLQCDSEFMRHFDVRMNFRRDCDVPLLYFDSALIPHLQNYPTEKKQRGRAAFFASNDFALNNRFEWAAELMEHMPVDSYGKSQNNCQLKFTDSGRMTKLETIREYDFYLAFENSNCIDYVSEKMFDGLISGTVPVYLGAPNVDDYLPGNNCIIKATDFANGADLAKFLLEVSADRQRYSEYLKWKNEPLRPDFLTLVHERDEEPLRRLCAKLLEWKPMATQPIGPPSIGTPQQVDVLQRIKGLAKRFLPL